MYKFVEAIFFMIIFGYQIGCFGSLPSIFGWYLNLFYDLFTIIGIAIHKIFTKQVVVAVLLSPRNAHLYSSMHVRLCKLAYWKQHIPRRLVFSSPQSLMFVDIELNGWKWKETMTSGMRNKQTRLLRIRNVDEFSAFEWVIIKISLLRLFCSLKRNVCAQDSRIVCDICLCATIIGTWNNESIFLALFLWKSICIERAVRACAKKKTKPFSFLGERRTKNWKIYFKRCFTIYLCVYLESIREWITISVA